MIIMIFFVNIITIIIIKLKKMLENDWERGKFLKDEKKLKCE